jgi:2-polyprenyl-6-methoxyphenol hydroxylase-like FAD-dependent oxidoreductase
MQHEAVDLIRHRGRVIGVEARTPQGTVQIRANLVVGCDGRHSTTRKAAAAEVVETGTPIDVLWFRVSRNADDPDQVLGNINYGKALILINRGDYFQSGLIIRKGSFEEIKRDGLDAFRKSILQIAPYLGDRVEALRDWEQIKLLSVQINHSAPLALAGTLVHRRCRPCDVASRRRWHKPCGSGCRRDGESAGCSAAGRTGHRGAAGACATTAGVSHAGDAKLASHGA